MTKTLKLEVILRVTMLVSMAGAALAQSPERTPVLTTPRFAFYSDFETNLNDALIAAGVARKGGKGELFRSGDEAVCFDKLPPSARAAWNGAVSYYTEIIAPVEWNARQQFLIRMQLAGFDESSKDAGARQFTDIAGHVRAAAAPAYRACRWTAQDAKNRRWLEELKPLLAAHEEKIAPRLQELYGKRWPVLPILMDVVETVNWSGATTAWSDAGQGHILLASEPQGPAALELVFHESSHILMDRPDPVRQALDSAARAADFRPPGDLWHLVLFYTTGETVRRILEDAGTPGYTPMLYEIFKRDSWVEYRDALERTWRPYVRGERTLAEASADLIEALRKPR
ncbi:MAG TPA: hypothetical protein VE974_14430 [Thermoanaerobaculia bacterium]|nr:hypothetical protein [Thermoanaerobaculia bacterium]